MSCRPVIERLDAEPVAHEIKFAFGFVPQREGEHADKSLRGFLDAPGGARFDQHFGVGMPAPVSAGKVGGDVARIIDFAVIGDHKTAIGACHWLVAGRR